MMIRKSSKSALSILALTLFGAASGVYAQGVFEGSGEEEDPNAPSCVGDGCGIETISAQEESQVKENSAEENAISEGSQGLNAEPSSENAQQETAATSVEQAPATEIQDSAKVAHMDDEEDSRDHFVTESHSDYQARKEGFSRRIQFGARVAAGTNMAFGDNDGWNLGVDVAGGIFARLPLTSSGLSVVSGLEFGYRHYSYDGKSDYGKNEAAISQMLFDIPVLLQFAIDEDGLFFGLGTDIQLKMQGESEFKQTIDTKEVHAKDKRNNTLPTTGVEVGITADIGYSITSWCQVDVRGTFNFTNLLDQDVIAESALMGAKLHLLHLNAGVTFLL